MGSRGHACGETVHAVLDSRFATGRMGPHELAKAKGQNRQADNGKRSTIAQVLGGSVIILMMSRLLWRKWTLSTSPILALS
jgi:hypothetical protein